MALSRSLELKLGELGNQPPRPRGAVGKSQANGKKPYDVIKLGDVESRPSRTTAEAVADEDLTPARASTATSTSDSPRTSWHNLTPVKVPISSCWKEIAAQCSSPMQVATPTSSQVMDAMDATDVAHKKCIALAALLASEQAGFTSSSTQFYTTSPFAWRAPPGLERPSPSPHRFAGFAPPGLERPVSVSPQVAGDSEDHGELPEPPEPPELPCTGKSMRKVGGRFLRRFVFTGLDAVNHADFELVPRLIGRGGCNIRPIRKACNAYIRVSEGDSEGGNNKPVEMVVCCGNQEDLDKGTNQLTTLLEDLRMHFSRNGCRRGISPIPELYRLLP